MADRNWFSPGGSDQNRDGCQRTGSQHARSMAGAARSVWKLLATRPQGLRLTFEDQGPGIADIELAMKDGYTSGSGLGLGLSGAKRLASEFELVRVGEGTRVTIVKWK